MKDKNKYGNGSDKSDGGHENAVPRRTYLKGLGTAAVLSGVGLSGTSTVAASPTGIGYGEGGYGEFGYGGVTDSQDDHVELTIIVEDADGSPIEGVEVFIHDTPIRTGQTDADGQVIVTLEKGAYNVEASKDGFYTEAVMDVEATESGRASTRLVLEE